MSIGVNKHKIWTSLIQPALLTQCWATPLPMLLSDTSDGNSTHCYVLEVCCLWHMRTNYTGPPPPLRAAQNTLGIAHAITRHRPFPKLKLKFESQRFKLMVGDRRKRNVEALALQRAPGCRLSHVDCEVCTLQDNKWVTVDVTVEVAVLSSENMVKGLQWSSSAGRAVYKNLGTLPTI